MFTDLSEHEQTCVCQYLTILIKMQPLTTKLFDQHELVVLVYL